MSDNAPAQVTYAASRAEAENRRRQALARLRRLGKLGRLYLPTGAAVSPRDAVKAEIRAARDHRHAAAEGLPAPVPSAARYSARGTNGAPVTGSDLEDEFVCKTDPVTGAMILPDLAMPSVNPTRAYEKAMFGKFRDRNGCWHDAKTGRFTAKPAGKW